MENPSNINENNGIKYVNNGNTNSSMSMSKADKSFTKTDKVIV